MGSGLAEFVKAYDIRGIVPDQLNPSVAQALGVGFGTVVSRDGPSVHRVVIGHDMRPSSPALVAAFARGVVATGLDVTRLGLTSTDELYFASGSLDAPGAMFTASHNPAAYNGIKLCRSEARPISSDTGLTEIRGLAEEILDGKRDVPTGSGTITDADVLGDYARFLRDLVDLSSIRPLTVVVDAGNGMAGHTVPAVLGEAAGLPSLPLDIVELYFELDGTFPNHEANPLVPENLVDLQKAVVERGADLGLAFDGDADRCFVVDASGEPVSASAITALIAEREIARAVRAGADPSQVRIVHNVITSLAVPEVIREAGAEPVRTRVGHSFIKAEMAEVGAVFGGEHSAHYYFRDFWFADTGMLAAMHVLAALGGDPQARSLRDLVRGHERYVGSGEINSTVADGAAATARVVNWADRPDITVDRLDGLTVHHPGRSDDPMWWFNLRASNTEPLLRLNVEAADEATMCRVRDTVLSLVRGSDA